MAVGYTTQRKRRLYSNVISRAENGVMRLIFSEITGKQILPNPSHRFCRLAVVQSDRRVIFLFTFKYGIHKPTFKRV